MNGLDAWLATGATAGFWLCVGWLLVGFAVAVLAEAPGALGALCGRIAARVSPPLIRRAAQCATGLVLTTASVVGAGGAAGAAMEIDAPGPSPISALSGPPDPTALPDLDRPTAGIPIPSPAGGSPTAPVRLPTGTAGSPSVMPRLPLSPQPASTGATDAEPSRPTAGDPPRDEAATTAVVVVRGDTLWDIAARELGGEPRNRDIAERWPDWYAANRSVIGSDPDLILPGQRLSPPE